MNETEIIAARYEQAHGSPGPSDAMPEIRINLFGGFEVLVDGVPLNDYSALRKKRLKVLASILALNHGRELRSLHLAQSIWPDSPPQKQRNSFYNLWYLMVHALVPDGVDVSLYFSREQFSCRLLDQFISTDVEDVERVCAELEDPGLDPVRALAAYQCLQRVYRGDLLPGEEDNAIIVRARMDWRDRVAEALSAAANAMLREGERNTALWMVKAACRIDETREDLARMRMKILIEMGRPAAALQVYNDMREALLEQTGVGPSRQSTLLMQDAIQGSALELRIPLSPARGPLRGPASAGGSRRQRSHSSRAGLPV